METAMKVIGPVLLIVVVFGLKTIDVWHAFALNALCSMLFKASK